MEEVFLVDTKLVNEISTNEKYGTYLRYRVQVTPSHLGLELQRRFQHENPDVIAWSANCHCAGPAKVLRNYLPSI